MPSPTLRAAGGALFAGRGGALLRATGGSHGIAASRAETGTSPCAANIGISVGGSCKHSHAQRSNGSPPFAATAGGAAMFSDAGQRRSVSTLVLLRHGKSIWNGDTARFTGWADVPLTVQGRVEAVAAGQLLRSRGMKASKVCVAFASELERSHETCELALASMAGHEQETWSSDRIRRDWKLNERHYGAVQGRLKNDPALREEYGEATLVEWRRSLHGKPPPMDEAHEYYQPPPAPLTESLADCQKRVVSCWEESISRALFDEADLPIPPQDRTVMVVAHANTLRALMAHFDELEEEQVPNLYVPNSVPILYHFDHTTRKPVEEKLENLAGSSHARWMLSAENHSHIRQAISSGGTLTRALFDAMDTTQDGMLCRSELEAGIRELMKPEAGPENDCAVLDLAKKCAFSMTDDEYITYEEFERRTAEAYDEVADRAAFYEDEDNCADLWL